jgi:putative hydrolase of the HAD superfamily
VEIPRSVRCVFFDAVGTLIFADPPVGSVYAAAARGFGLSLDEELLCRRFVEAFEKHHARSNTRNWQRTDQAQEVERWRSIVASVFPEVADSENLFQRLWGHFAQVTSWRLYADVVPCWQKLIDQGLKHGLASNFDDRLLTICRGLPPLDRLEHVLISSQLGFRKPSVQFFRAIEAAMELSSHELLLIGDDRESDYSAAHTAGWHAIHLDRTNASDTPDAIHSLAELQ